jgi:hypothetical protein
VRLPALSQHAPRTSHGPADLQVGPLPTSPPSVTGTVTLDCGSLLPLSRSQPAGPPPFKLSTVPARDREALYSRAPNTPPPHQPRLRHAPFSPPLRSLSPLYHPPYSSYPPYKPHSSYFSYLAHPVHPSPPLPSSLFPPHPHFPPLTRSHPPSNVRPRLVVVAAHHTGRGESADDSISTP